MVGADGVAPESGVAPELDVDADPGTVAGVPDGDSEAVLDDVGPGAAKGRESRAPDFHHQPRASTKTTSAAAHARAIRRRLPAGLVGPGSFAVGS